LVGKVPFLASDFKGGFPVSPSRIQLKSPERCALVELQGQTVIAKSKHHNVPQLHWVVAIISYSEYFTVKFFFVLSDTTKE
jgi:hypothetical protein